MKLDLEKVWQVMNTLSGRELGLSEENCYISLLGNSSDYCGDMLFEEFLNYYSFRLDGNDIIIFNDDKVAWEDYTVGDFSSFPLSLLSFGEKELEDWMDEEIEKQLKQQELNRIQEKEDIKRQIELLQKRLNN